MSKPPRESVETWLEGTKPPGFRNGADVVLVLDDNTELLAHSAFLAAHSHVLCDMFYGSGCKATAHEDGEVRWRIPLQKANLEQATNFLEFVCSQGELDMSTDMVLSVIELLHRLDCRTALQRLEVYVRSRIGYCESKPKDYWVSSGTCLAAHTHGSLCARQFQYCRHEDSVMP